MPLSRDDLDRAYRESLRRELQLRKAVQDRDEIILRIKAKLLGGLQQVDLELQRLAREDERNVTANDVNRLELPR